MGVPSTPLVKAGTALTLGLPQLSGGLIYTSTLPSGPPDISSPLVSLLPLVPTPRLASSMVIHAALWKVLFVPSSELTIIYGLSDGTAK